MIFSGAEELKVTLAMPILVIMILRLIKISEMATA